VPDIAKDAGDSLGLAVNAPTAVAQRKRGAAASRTGATTPIATLHGTLAPSRRATIADATPTAKYTFSLAIITRRMVDRRPDSQRLWSGSCLGIALVTDDA